MFCVDEYVVYGSEGVCKVESIGHPDISGLDATKEYYTLLPVYHSGKIYTPTDSHIPMRNAITKEKAHLLIDDIENVGFTLDVPRDAKQAAQYYKDLVRTYKCENLISIVKYVTKKQHKLSQIKKNLPAVDQKFLKIAQDMLCGELSFALDKDPQEVREKLDRCFRCCCE